MARPRLELHALLKSLDASVQKVYFQPPNGTQMVYPCIVYSRDDQDVRHADNQPYQSHTRYMVTVIDRDPDSVIPKKLALLPLCSFNRFFAADNLNHDVYNLYF